MHELLAALRAASEPTRLRLLALAARGAFCVVEFTEILGQSQPRLSRHLRLLCDARLLERSREGANVWFTLGPDGALARDLLGRLPADEPVLLADRRHAARVLAERARVASDSFRREGRDWDEMHALGLPADAVERALLSLLPPGPLGRVLDVGTGTGRLLALLGPRAEAALGVDASRAMLALARARLAELDLPACTVRLGDMYRLDLPPAYDLAVLQMVLHHAEDPAAALAEAARCLRPGGRLLVVELAPHAARHARARTLAHRWPGFADAAMASMLRAAGLRPLPPLPVPAPDEASDALAPPGTAFPDTVPREPPRPGPALDLGVPTPALLDAVPAATPPAGVEPLRVRIWAADVPASAPSDALAPDLSRAVPSVPIPAPPPVRTRA